MSVYVLNQYSPGTRGTKIHLNKGTGEQAAKKDQGTEGQWHSWTVTASSETHIERFCWRVETPSTIHFFPWSTHCASL